MKEKLDTMDQLEKFEKISAEREKKKRQQEKKRKGYATTKMEEVK